MVCLWQSANQNSNVSLQFISIYHSRSRVLFSRGSSLCIYYVSSDWTGQGADSSWIVAFLDCYMTIWPEGVPVISIQSVLVTRVSEQDTRYSLLQAGDKGVEGDVPTSLWIARQQEWQEWQQECISYHFDTFSYSMSFCFLCGGM